MDDAAERDSGLTWEAYLPGLFDQPDSAAPPPPPARPTVNPETRVAEPKQQQSRPAPPPPPPPDRSPQARLRAAQTFTPTAALGKILGRTSERSPLSSRMVLVVGVAIFLGLALFIALLP